MSFSNSARMMTEGLDDGEACGKDGTVGCSAPVHNQDSHANHAELYKHARIYDVAFAYRDFAAELAFLRACHARWGTGPTDSFLEVAAGPGVHAIVAAQAGMRATALDLAPSMMALCEKKARDANVDVTALVGDMRSFVLDETVALAFNPITSISYLRTVDALREHMRSIARALRPGGVYVVENNHPKDFFTDVHFVPSIWTMKEGDLEVKTTWLAECPPKMDTAAQLYEAVARYEIDDGGHHSTVQDRAWLRMTLPGELELAAQLAGLEPCAVLGDLDVNASFDDAGWRAVSVFAKPSTPEGTAKV
jgi:ubiquinone/menaquinone biosynthesis C-methylase UbiE